MTKQKKLLRKVKEAINSLLPYSVHLYKQDIIVFSRFRWNVDSQRKRHIFSKLATQRKILFIEEPIPFDPLEKNKAVIHHPQKNITVLQPKVSIKNLAQELPLLIAKQIRSEKLQNPILWFHSTTFNDIIPFLNHSLIVYDFMDKQQFIHQYNASETYLFSIADIIFTNEKLLYDEMPRNARNLYYLHTNGKVLTANDWEDIVYQMQDIIQYVLKAKARSNRRFIPTYYPFITRLTTS